MQETWKRRVTIGGIGLTLGLVLIGATAVGPPRGTADPIDRQASERTAYDDMGLATRGSREFPTPGTPKLTSVDQSDGVFGPGTESGGAYFPGVGTVSHASIDNNFDRLMDRFAPSS